VTVALLLLASSTGRGRRAGPWCWQPRPWGRPTRRGGCDRIRRQLPHGARPGLAGQCPGAPAPHAPDQGAVPRRHRFDRL